MFEALQKFISNWKKSAVDNQSQQETPTTETAAIPIQNYTTPNQQNIMQEIKTGKPAKLIARDNKCSVGYVYYLKKSMAKQ